MSCQFCEEPLPASARYCPSCGTGVWPPPSGKNGSGGATTLAKAFSPKLLIEPPAHPSATTSPLAIAAFAFGIAGWTILPVVGAFLAVPLGHRALREIARSPERYEGSGAGEHRVIAGIPAGRFRWWRWLGSCCWS